jgi:hypothetical protein
MPQSIPVPSQSLAKYRVPLNGLSYIFVFRFNGRDERWYFDLYSDEEELLKGGVKVMENQSLLKRYLIDNFNGDIICEKVSQGDSFVGRDNLGIDKDYELVYYTQEELDSV